MSKADLLGASSSAFSRASSPRSARGRAIDTALSAASPTELAVHLLGHNPDNPRESLGDVTDTGQSLRDHGQKQPLAVMTREAYLEANPGREDDLEPRAMYVVIDGNRRLAAAREAGVTSLKVMVDDALGTSSQEILESALVANIHRQDLEPLDEARALRDLLTVHGTQEKLAKRLHRSQGWVSQRLALLGLTPELKERLERGEESAGLLRRVGKKPPEQQEAELRRLKEEQEQRKTSPPARPAQVEPPGPARDLDAPAAGVPASTGPPRASATRSPAASPAPMPSPRPQTPEVPRPPEEREPLPAMVTAEAVPWGDPRAVARLARRWMSEDGRRELAKFLTDDLG